MEVDLERYQGKWYEQAKKPVIFQLQCVADTTAEYEIEDDHVKVVNTCTSFFGITSRIEGKAFFTDKPNVLSVKFFPFFPGADYVVEHVDEEYQHAIVGSPSKRYLWFLTREKNISPEKLEDLEKIAEKKGYDVSNVVETRQR